MWWAVGIRYWFACMVAAALDDHDRLERAIVRLHDHVGWEPYAGLLAKIRRQGRRQ